VLSGRTLTPLEPSEAIETLGRGAVNAGFIFFALLILSTLILGRFFCGWGCHIVALQDLCGWLLRRAGIRPRPFRSRLLVFVPLLAAVWMFVAPTLIRHWLGQEVPAWRAEIISDDFWGRFPGWGVALMTFAVCGFLIVYVLGNKGFCTYGCPYGGIFGVVDRVAPGRIRVTDACEGCGHCTATCTSNVRVHEEVRLYRAVVDPGCMKCMDCVSVCPKDALYFGFGAPAVLKGKPRGTPRARRYDYTWPEELAMAATFLVTVAILRALYDAIPFLLALGLASIGAWLLITAWRVRAGGRRVQFLHIVLANAGARTRAGGAFLSIAILWCLFLVHSAWVQYLVISGTRTLDAAIAQVPPGETPGPGAARLFQSAATTLRRADALGLVTVPSLLARLGSAHSHLGNHVLAEDHYRRAAESAPGFASAHFELARYAVARGDGAAAVDSLVRVVRADPEYPGAADTLARLMVERGREQEAAALLGELRSRRPESAPLSLTHAFALAEIGEMDRAADLTRAVLEEEPENALAWNRLAGVMVLAGKNEEALDACRRAVAHRPDAGLMQFHCAGIAVRLDRWEVALGLLDSARRIDPFNRAWVDGWGLALLRTGRLDETIAALEREEPTEEIRFALDSLHRAAASRDGAAAPPAGSEGPDGSIP